MHLSRQPNTAVICAKPDLGQFAVDFTAVFSEAPEREGSPEIVEVFGEAGSVPAASEEKLGELEPEILIGSDDEAKPEIPVFSARQATDRQQVGADILAKPEIVQDRQSGPSELTPVQPDKDQVPTAPLGPLQITQETDLRHLMLDAVHGVPESLANSARMVRVTAKETIEAPIGVPTSAEAPKVDTGAILVAKAGRVPETLRSVAEQVTEALRGRSQGAIEVVLRPENLGVMKVRLIATDAGLVLYLGAEKSETQELIRRHADCLLQEFRDMGFDASGLSFGSNHRQSQAVPEPPGGKPSAFQGEEAPKGRSGTRLLVSSRLDMRV